MQKRFSIFELSEVQEEVNKDESEDRKKDKNLSNNLKLKINDQAN